MPNDPIEDSLRRIEHLLQSVLRVQIAQALNTDAFTETERMVYELTGSAKRNEICKSLKISPNTLADIRTRLVGKGLLVKDGSGFRKPVD